MTRVLIFNFFGRVMERGIPLYAQDIAECMRRVGIEAVELRCPRCLQRVPRRLRNLLFVVFEQLVAPAMRVMRGCSITVYPYNSVGVVDAVLGRSVLIIHDLISNDQHNRSLASRYVRLTQAVQRKFARPICAASEHTLSRLRRIDAFRRCPLHLWSNPFYTFEGALERVDCTPSRSPREQLTVLLCSGMGPNKDYSGALKLFAQSRILGSAQLRVVGFGDDGHLAERRLAHLPKPVRERIVILPRLSLGEIVSEYLHSDLVWVHSQNEGFGRSVVEARLSGRPVVASNIGAFTKFRGPDVSLYKDATFEACVAAMLDNDHPPVGLNVGEYHFRLESAVNSVVANMGNGSQAARAQ